MAKHLDPNKEADFRKLMTAQEVSFRGLSSFRTHRLNAYRQMTGAHYGPPSQTASPMNFLELASNIYLRHLAASTPKVIWTTTDQSLKATAMAVEMAQNHVLKEMNWRRTQRLWVMEGLYSPLSVVKVALTSKLREGMPGFNHDAGEPFADIIFFDDWVHDMAARKWEYCRFMGNRYQLPLGHVLEEFKLSKIEREAAKEAATNSHQVFTEYGDARSDSLSKGNTPPVDDLEQLVVLWDLWLPRTNQIVTLTDIFPSRAMGVVDWTGHERGPFHKLSYNDVPGNVTGLPPVALMQDLHNLANQIFIKLGKQGLRQKTVTGYRGTAAQDAERLGPAADGASIAMLDPDGIKIFEQKGIDPTNLAFLLQIKDLFAYLAGNIDALGGLGPQANTLGQEQLLTSVASRRIEDMRDITTEATTEVMEAIGGYIFDDPHANYKFIKRIGGRGLEGVDININFTSAEKDGTLGDFALEILPNSMQQLTPAERLKTITQVIERFAIPLLPLLQQQGKGLDMDELMDIIARYSGVHELRSIIIDVEPAEPQSGETRQSPNTTRTNIRQNIPGATRSGKDAVLTQALLGAGAQPAENATLTRPTG